MALATSRTGADINGMMSLGSHRSFARRRVLASLSAVATLALASACGPSSSASAWREHPDSVGYRVIEGAASACMDCIELGPMVTLGDGPGEGFLEDRGTLEYVVRDREGRYWVGQRGSIKVFAPDGRYLRAVGRRGQGPLEFEFAQPHHVDSSGMVHVLDVRLGRETIVRPDFTREADRRIPVGFDDVAVLPGEEERYVIAKWIPTPERLGFPLHVVAGDDVIRSFGLTPRADTTAVTPVGSLRVVSVTPDGYVLSSMVDEYVVEAWKADGARIAGFELPGLNPTAIRPGVFAWDNPPPNHVGAVAPHDDPFVIVVTRHRRPEWKDLVVERVSSSGIPYLSSADGNVPTLYRSRIDMVNLNTATIVASSWYDGWLMRFIERDVILRLAYSDEGAPLLQVLKLTYRAK